MRSALAFLMVFVFVFLSFLMCYSIDGSSPAAIKVLMTFYIGGTMGVICGKGLDLIFDKGK